MKATPLRRRRLYRPVYSGPSRQMTELHAAMLVRDRMCVLARLNWPGHLCRTAFGQPHAADNLALLTMEHFWPDYAVKGKRAPDDLDHVVALCGATNVGAPSKEMREAFRAYVIEANRR